MTIFFQRAHQTVNRLIGAAAAFILVLSVSACGTPGAAGHAAARKIPLQAQDIDKLGKQSGQSAVVVYRAGIDASDGFDKSAYPPVNLYINGDYHVSLRPNAQVELALCAGVQRFLVLQDSISTALIDKSDKGTDFQLTQGDRTYLRIVLDLNGVASLKAVSAEVARLELAKQAQPFYTVSRMEKKLVCDSKGKS